MATLPEVSHRTVFSQYQKEGEAVYMAVDEGAKYVYSAPDHREFLFATTSDGREQANLISDSAMQTTVERLRGELQSELSPFEEGRALNNGTWREYPRLSMPENSDHGLLYQDQPFDDIRIPAYQPDNRIMPQFMTGPS